ncbi:MAG: YwmB family TATA-box binding protein [Lachnospira sp.]
MSGKFSVNEPGNFRKSINRFKYNHYKVLRVCVLFAVFLWILSAVRVVNNVLKDKTENVDMVTAFCDNIYMGNNARISACGNMENMYLTESAREFVLVSMAEKIGINNYTIENIGSDGKEQTVLWQDSKNGKVKITIENLGKTDNSSVCSYYLCTEINLYNSTESAFDYKAIVEKIYGDYGIDTTVTVDVKGFLVGDVSLDIRNQIAEEMLKEAKATLVAERKDNDIYTIYAYDEDYEDYITIGGKRVNMNITMSYDENEDITNVILSTPINNFDY